ncbi:MAG: OmpA family protein [Bdellovibrionota bacterium]
MDKEQFKTTSNQIDYSKRGKKSEALWLMSFSDMSLALLCFFVLMISTMKQNKEKFEHVKEGMTAKAEINKQNSLKKLSTDLNKIIKQKKLQKSAQVIYDNDGLAIEFKDGLLFNSGSARTNPRFKSVTDQVMHVLAKLPSKYHLVIEGHTDDVPLRKNKSYQSNWELAAARGFSLMRQLQGFGVLEAQMSVTSYAHTRPKIPTANLSGQSLLRARSTNRRVVIRIQ